MPLLVAWLALVLVVMLEAWYRQGVSVGREQARDYVVPTADTLDPSFRPTLLDAWMQNRMEFDRSLLTLSGGGVGLVATYISTVPSIDSPLLLSLVIISLGSFMITMLATMVMFRLNTKLIEAMISGDLSNEPRLSFLDRIAPIIFIVGVAALVALAIATYLAKRPA